MDPETERQGRDGSHGPRSQWTPKITTEAERGERSQFPPQLSEAPHADTWIGHFWPPELWDNKLLLLKLPSGWDLVTAALANRCRDGQLLTLHWPQRARGASLDDFLGVFGFLPLPPSGSPAPGSVRRKRMRGLPNLTPPLRAPASLDISDLPIEPPHLHS